MESSFSLKKPHQVYPILFQIFLWAIWVGYPLINADYGNEEAMHFLKMHLVVRTFEIPLFYLIINYMIPQLFFKKGIPTYFFTLVIICTIYIFVEDNIKIIVNPYYDRKYIFFIIFPILFIAAMGTGYGLVTHYQKQERNREFENQERLKSELSFLRSQISPHFIFNVLNSIVYLIRIKSDAAEPITIKLSELLRYMLYESDLKQVPISKEIDYLKNYIDLQKVRYADDVAIDMEISDQDCGCFNIEPMLLIPFVENAFKHGIGMVLDPFIKVSLSCQNNQLKFIVVNKIAPEESDQKDASSGIGLKNIKRRLELLYPEHYSLDINQENGLFEAQLIIDFKKVS